MNDGQIGIAIKALRAELGGLEGVDVLVLGLMYRDGVKELAYTRALPLIERLAEAGARVTAWDPLLDGDEIAELGAMPWTWGESSDARAIVTQTADRAFRSIHPAWFRRLEVVLDGRNTLDGVGLGGGVRILGVGRPARGERAARPGVG